MQIGAKTALWVLWQLNYVRDVPILGDTEKQIAGKILNIFLTLGAVNFSDIWYNILPMDNSIQDSLMPTCFAEFWVDMDRAPGTYHVYHRTCTIKSAVTRCGRYAESVA
jgi:D-arabinono-1,4-lactone oxidase